ncbi:hypothetical protein PN462_16655, partial [Spirulina sp. CS-785/01]
LSLWGYKLRQMWLHPILDFSLPPQTLYTRLPAWQLLDSPDTLNLDSSPLVLIAPGGYPEAGVEADGEDNFPLPPALAYWRQQTGDQRDILTGGEVHGYLIHHFQQQHFILPIPDLWLVLLVALLHKAWTLHRPKNRETHPPKREIKVIFYSVGGVVYGVISWQLYITAQILLPWLFPLLTWGLLSLPAPGKSRRDNGAKPQKY